MACACKASRDIEALNRRFGVEGGGNVGFWEKLGDFFYKLFLVTVEILLLPIIAVTFPFILIKSLRRNEAIDLADTAVKIARKTKRN